jgi:hypothetical protein
MKLVRMTAALMISLALVFGTTSCVVLVEKDHGKHRGWYKNSNDPHHPNSTNPGKSKRNHK